MGYLSFGVWEGDGELLYECGAVCVVVLKRGDLCVL